MTALAWLIPCALLLGLIGLAAFLWSLNSGQFEDLEGAGCAPCRTTSPDEARTVSLFSGPDGTSTANPSSPLSSRALCPGSIYQLTPAFADGWIPGTSPGMTPALADPIPSGP